MKTLKTLNMDNKSIDLFEKISSKFNMAIIYKDLKRIKIFLGIFIFLYFIFAFYTYYNNLHSFLYYSFTDILNNILLICPLIPLLLFYDEKYSKSTYFLQTMPISKKSFVFTKYFLGIFVIVIQFILAFTSTLIFSIITKLQIAQNFYSGLAFFYADTKSYIFSKTLTLFFVCVLVYSFFFFIMFLYNNFFQTLFISGFISLLIYSTYFELITTFHNLNDSYKLNTIIDQFTSIYLFSSNKNNNLFLRFGLIYWLLFFIIILILCFIFYKLSIFSHILNVTEYKHVLFQNKISEIILLLSISLFLSLNAIHLFFIANSIKTFLIWVILFYSLLVIIMKKLNWGIN